ncbi:hypothetical protein [Halocatena marina]|uniref:hypothetical protein n=1 Tax=Halocatena marina TaxID=2934937 RepID=UPI00200BF87C|nr:hypothetical protein [Halocatena marina]
MAANTTASLLRYFAPLSQRIEMVALHTWVVATNIEPVVAWPVVLDSSTATLFIACSLVLYKLSRSNQS